MARLSAGGFFKNFVKGAAQQYNANVAYLEQQKVEEEKQKKKEARELKSKQDLLKIEYGYEAQVEALKSDKNKKSLLSISLPNSNTVFTVPNTIAGQEIQLTGMTEPQKNRNIYQAFKASMNDNVIDNLRKSGDLNTVANSFATTWYNQLPTFVKKEDGIEKPAVTVETTDWQYINKYPEFAEAVAKKVGQTRENLTKLAIEQENYTNGKLVMKQVGDKIEMTLDDVVPKEYGLQPKHIDILRKQAPRFNKFNPNEEVKLQPLVAEINNVLKLPENQPEKGQVTMTEMVDAIAVASPILANVKEPTRLDSFALEELKANLKNSNIDPYIYNDVDLLGKVISLSLPAKFKSAKILNVMAGEELKLGADRVVRDIIGNKKALQNVALKARLAGDLETDATAVEQLSRSGANIGLATTPQAIQNLVTVSSNVVMDGIGLIIENTTGKQIDSRLVFQDMFKNANQRLQRGMQSQNEQDRKNALLEFYATTMAFRMAAQIQNTGDTGSGPRISDDDVRRIASGLAQDFVNNPDKLQSVARGIRLEAERQRKIYQMYRSNKVHQIVTASILEDMYQGALPLAVQELTSGNGTSGVQLIGTYIGGDSQVINIPINDDKKEVITPPNQRSLGTLDTSTKGLGSIPTDQTIEDEFEPIKF